MDRGKSRCRCRKIDLGDCRLMHKGIHVLYDAADTDRRDLVFRVPARCVSSAVDHGNTGKGTHWSWNVWESVSLLPSTGQSDLRPEEHAHDQEEHSKLVAGNPHSGIASPSAHHSLFSFMDRFCFQYDAPGY